MARKILIEFDDALHLALRQHGLVTRRTLADLLAAGARLLLAEAASSTVAAAPAAPAKSGG